MKLNTMSLLTTAKAPTQGASGYRMCVTAGQTGSDTSARSERLALVEALATEPDRLFCKQVCNNRNDVEARILELEASMLRMERMAQRLRELLPEGVRLGDYLIDSKHAQKQRLRPARRIY
jgi:hypothetical protein